MVLFLSLERQVSVIVDHTVLKHILDTTIELSIFPVIVEIRTELTALV